MAAHSRRIILILSRGYRQEAASIESRIKALHHVASQRFTSDTRIALS